eukprot:CAMPEP_0183483716 /NCGR_PEP_ID=MMETSP0370-20130417/178554_1 /TAXON_ID=268820 /ORGANISM="Peridinium aciculiferum, Strain PAER-2" /LENGTH=235 /DNA_ID=CAMNT_0025676991 /DNA_START=44 /DNA_END=748 /DNA_ORIENTATION=-
MPIETVSFLDVATEEASGDESSYEQAHGQRRDRTPWPAKAGIALVLGAMMLLGLAAWPAAHHGMSLRAAGTIEMSEKLESAFLGSEDILKKARDARAASPIEMSEKPESAFLGSEDILKKAKCDLKKIPHASQFEKEEMKIQWDAMLKSLDYAYSQYAATKKGMESQFGKASAEDLEQMGLPPSATKEQIMAAPDIKKAFADIAFTLKTIQKCTDATNTVLEAFGGKAASAIETP